jgi:hypothetical protein
MPNIKRQLVLVEWADAESHDDWQESEDVGKWIKEKNFICREVGWVLEDNKDMLVLTSQIGDGDLIGNRTKIPKPWIRSKKVLKIQ